METNSPSVLVPRPEPRADLAALFPPKQRVLSTLLEVQADRHGDRPLLAAGKVQWSFREACSIAAGRAATLAAAGVTPGDRVAILSANRAEVLEVFLGCGWLGAVAVPINTAARLPQVEHIIADCGAELVIVEAGLAPVVRESASRLRIREIWLIGGAGEASFGPGIRPMPDRGAPIPPQPMRPGDLAAILYTSGTTGAPKGVCCTHGHCFWWGANSAQLLGVGKSDILLTCLPLFHINALNTFYQALVTGAMLVLEPRFSASQFWSAAASRGATVTYLLGAMVPILLAQPPGPCDRGHSVRVALGPAVPEAMHEHFKKRFGVPLLDGYGSTETNFVIGDPVDERVPGYMGRLRKGFSARVVDADDNPVPDGEAGELILRADEPFSFASGYFNRPAETLQAWRNLWFHTGDRVVRDKGGLFRFVDRLKDVIRRRGENISAHEVEQVLSAFPAVVLAAVFPVPSDLAEDEVMAAIVLAPAATATPQALLDHCQRLLPYFAVPRYIDFVDALPTTENGKIQKFELRERGVTARTWDRDAAGYVLRR